MMKYINCSKCGSKINDGDNYCKYCGRKVMDEMFDPVEKPIQTIYGPPIEFIFKCKKCNTEWYSTMVQKHYCPKCGEYNEPVEER